MTVEIFQLSFCVFAYAFPPEISSIFGNGFPLFCVILTSILSFLGGLFWVKVLDCSFSVYAALRPLHYFILEMSLIFLAFQCFSFLHQQHGRCFGTSSENVVRLNLQK